ncbi:hypothetical protein [Chryseobacterium mulctrae]|uniref:hypothetical protein n=1 Tax=Chryseobacterium mulctrae TaxID=2576777 RepID=UPI00111784DD|nr:hypothetical protein [Chryseobacterium mulctrae]
MRKTYYLFFFLLSIHSFSQNKISGVYQNELGEKLILYSDKTFEYTWGFDLASSWNIGTWDLKKNKYIYLSTVEVKDTLRLNNKIQLVLSRDRISNQTSNIEYFASSISGGGQSRSLPPNKLILKDKVLFTFFKSGKIRNKREKSMMDANIYSKPWFEKISEIITGKD